MIRRTFLKLMIPMFLFLAGCVQRLHSNSHKISEESKHISNLYDYWVEAYNRGDIEGMMNVFEPECTFVSDSILGDSNKLKKMMNVMYRRQKRQNILPINYTVTVSKSSKQIGWSVLTVRDNTAKKAIGHLTLLAKKSGQKYRIIHYHFSR